MATLRFNGASQAVIGSGNGALNGALTVAALFKRADGNSTILFAHKSGGGASAGDVFSFFCETTQITLFVPPTAPTVSRSTAVLSGTGDWWLVAFTRAAGTVAPRFHFKNITTGGAWSHLTGDNAQANPISAAGGGLRVGTYRSGGSADDLNGDVGLLGIWDGTALNDAQIESLAANLRTSDWNTLTPSSLTDFNTLTPTDLKSLVTWILSGPTLAGTDPPGWTFGLAAPAPPVNSVAPAVTGTAVNGQTLTCSTGTWTGSPTGYTYQWKRGGTNISGATASTYTLVTADKGTSVKCTVTTTNTDGSASADSNAVTVSSTLDALPAAGDVLIRTSTGWTKLT